MNVKIIEELIEDLRANAFVVLARNRELRDATERELDAMRVEVFDPIGVHALKTRLTQVRNNVVRHPTNTDEADAKAAFMSDSRRLSDIFTAFVQYFEWLSKQHSR